MGIVAGLLATVTVSALLVNPEQRPENRYNDAARYCYVVFLILSTFFNLSAISISFEVYHTTLKIPLSGMLDFAASFKGSSRTEGYMHIYIGCYSLWCAIMAALYMLHGAGPFFIALGAAVAFVGHVTVLTNQLYNSLLRSFERHGKAGAHAAKNYKESSDEEGECESDGEQEQAKGKGGKKCDVKGTDNSKMPAQEQGKKADKAKGKDKGQVQQVAESIENRAALLSLGAAPIEM
ncbi:hypothetical protein HXX76_011950 [Chlamydomonas incerta]|uniref:Uncharacterized protein n=1 Tax=Chlamydomonas incerta TaxID=51695 RepID=A0A835VW26_CHLIN|nr:hypothetical protein HXX76_011950 [Chlamydomonas incerta]|eukprot:KAG2427963.1 hypothetical protein HXX76_011950 [Chlamydomonas incerta]